ncbi:PIG-L deacetylase family protein [Vibrio metoecus]|uniref:PIG-L deacetylase family protein n=1 Tax=Vibrio metoecus TaxID=1481663 RepID=UPI00272CFC4A|nr:PIG-L deacetylase family protein [Vibrio metoecus]WKY93039.1 PIG-L deacetylase family protein [Vibrio metoecus]
MKVWFIGAHFDDIEIGCGGTAAKLISQGNDCHVTIVTHSGYSDEYGNVIRESTIARKEGLKGLTELGFKSISELNLETGKLEHGHSLIYELEKLSKEIMPDLVFTHWDKDVHQDHAAVAKSTFTVCRKTGSILMYRPNWYRTSINFMRIFSWMFLIIMKLKLKQLIAMFQRLLSLVRTGLHSLKRKIRLEGWRLM